MAAKGAAPPRAEISGVDSRANGACSSSGGDRAEVADQRTQRQILWYNRHKRQARAPRISDSHRRYLEDEGAFLELPRSTTDALLPIYNSLLDDLIPLVDGARVFRKYSNGQSSSYLIRAMCLVVCKTRQALPFLRLSEGSSLLEPLEFSSKVLSGLEAAIKADLEPDRITKIQILALMHLHNDGHDGAERSSSFLSQAVSAAWSLSLHWHLPGIPDQEQCQYLWWSLRSLDRLNKPVMGAAPFLIDDADVAIGRPEIRSSSYRSQVMAVSLALGDLMKRATKVYKASSSARSEDMQDFPTLAEVTDGKFFDSFLHSHQGYLEIWYHVTAMLSCRYSGPGSKPYVRRLASADRVLEMVGHGGHQDLPALPLIPYAMSMSTTIVYRALRDGERYLSRAIRDLKICCAALDALGERWTSARGIAGLAGRLHRLLSTPEPGDRSGGGGTIATGERVEGERSTLRTEHERASRGETSGHVTAVGPTPNGSVVSTSFPQELAGLWQSTTSYAHLDTAFHDLFDYAMPNVFRDPASWDFLHVNEEASLDRGAFPRVWSYGPVEGQLGSGFVPLGNGGRMS